MEINKQLEQWLSEYQTSQSTLQMIVMQKQQMLMQLEETDMALGELGKASGKVYRVVGGIMVERTKDAVEKDLKERKEMLDVRSKSLARQEEKLKERLVELKEKIETELKNQQMDQSAPRTGGA